MNANEIEAVTAALAKVAETERTLRARVDELERQLVAYDAALDGDLALAEQVAPGTFFIKRKHAAAQLPAAVLRQAFSAESPPGSPGAPEQQPDYERLRALALAALGVEDPIAANGRQLYDVMQMLQTAWQFGMASRRAAETPESSDDADYLRWVWGWVRPETRFVSCALPEGTGYRPRVDLAANGVSMPDPVSGHPLGRDECALPRPGQNGLPNDWIWLATSWRLEVRGGAGWDCSGLKGSLRFIYNDRHVATRPLSDALTPRDEDLLVVMRPGLSFAFEAEFERGITRLDAPADAPPPRLYVFLDVIAPIGVVV